MTPTPSVSGRKEPALRRLLKASLHRLARAVLARATLRGWSNRFYLKLSFSQKGLVYRAFAKAFRPDLSSAEPGTWLVDFGGRMVRLPLRPERMWLDWDNALAFAGHDIDIKQTYVMCLRSAKPPELFVDIGANYGTHSLLFLVHGVDVIALEPNSACHEDFRAICAQNRVVPRIEGLALGEEQGEVELVYPETETWLGTVQTSVELELQAEGRLRVERVPQRTLDDYQAELGHRRVLVKVDAEGSEYEVFRGGIQTLKQTRPLVIFESLGARDRHRLYELLAEERYGVALLPWDPNRPSPFLDLRRFVESPSDNFIAVPQPQRD